MNVLRKQKCIDFLPREIIQTAILTRNNGQKRRTKQTWSSIETKKLEEALKVHKPKDLKEISEFIGTRSIPQVRSKLQKYFKKRKKAQKEKKLKKIIDKIEKKETKEIVKSIQNEAVQEMLLKQESTKQEDSDAESQAKSECIESLKNLKKFILKKIDVKNESSQEKKKLDLFKSLMELKMVGVKDEVATKFEHSKEPTSVKTEEKNLKIEVKKQESGEINRAHTEDLDRSSFLGKREESETEPFQDEQVGRKDGDSIFGEGSENENQDIGDPLENISRIIEEDAVTKMGREIENDYEDVGYDQLNKSSKIMKFNKL